MRFTEQAAPPFSPSQLNRLLALISPIKFVDADGSIFFYQTLREVEEVELQDGTMSLNEDIVGQGVGILGCDVRGNGHRLYGQPGDMITVAAGRNGIQDVRLRYARISAIRVSNAHIFDCEFIRGAFLNDCTLVNGLSISSGTLRIGPGCTGPSAPITVSGTGVVIDERPTAAVQMIGDVVTLTINYASAPAANSLTAVKQPLLFGKACAVCIVGDDGYVQHSQILPLLTANSAPTMTDGAGNAVRYTLDVALNGHRNYNGTEVDDGNDASRMSEAQIEELITAGWGVLNHGNYHGYADGPVPGPGHTIAQNVDEMHTYAWTEFGWVCRVGVRPNSDAGYFAAFQSQGYLVAVSQGDEAGWPLYNQEYQHPPTLEAVPPGYFVLGRIFDDMANGQASVNALTNRYLVAKGDQSASAHPIVVLGMHVCDPATVVAALQSVHDQANDAVWVAGVHRVLEYRHTQQNAVITDVLNGNTRTVTIDYSNCSPLSRRDDLSLQLGAGGVAITSASITGTGATLTHNPATGLFNVLRPRTLTAITGRARA